MTMRALPLLALPALKDAMHQAKLLLYDLHTSPRAIATEREARLAMALTNLHDAVVDACTEHPEL